MKVTTAKFTDEEKKTLKENHNRFDFHTNFNFLKQHKGLGRRKEHILVAPTHSGKTTFTYSILRDLFFNKENQKENLRVFVLLSEESEDDFKLKFSDLAPTAHDKLDQITICSMVEDENKNTSWAEIKEYIDFLQPSVFIFDNLTTSKFYNDLGPSEQGHFAYDLKSLVNRINCSLFCVTHTGDKVDMNSGILINENHIRGSKTIVNIAEFVYILQPIQIGTRNHVFVNIKKHRGYEMENKFFKLVYHKETKSITEDIPIQFDEFKEVWQQRNKLDDRKDNSSKPKQSGNDTQGKWTNYNNQFRK